MTKLLKKAIALIPVSLMVLFLLCGCIGSNNNTLDDKVADKILESSKTIKWGDIEVYSGKGNVQSDGMLLEPDQERFIKMRVSIKDSDVVWSNYRYLVIKLLSDMDALTTIEFKFYKENNTNPSNILRYQMIPTRDITAVVDFKELKSDKYLLKTLPGMLKIRCSGLESTIEEITHIDIIVHPGYSSEFKRLKIEEVNLTNDLPEVTVKGDYMVDEFGQWIGYENDMTIHSKQELISRLRQEYERAKVDHSYPDGWSKYGGYKNLKFDKTGYFHLKKTKDRWWLVDPDGYAFYSNGICYGSRMGVFGFVDGMENLFQWIPDINDPEYQDAWCNASDIPEYVKRNGLDKNDRKLFNFARANMIKAFGADKWWDAWFTISTARIKRWGFNTIGVGVNNYVDEDMEKYLEDAKIPFVITLKKFPQTEKKIYRDFPDVYSYEYRENAKEFAEEQLKPFATNKYMIGYFINNEPEWKFQNVNLAERTFASPEWLFSKKYLVSLLMEKYKTISSLNHAWGTSFQSFADLYQPMKDLNKSSQQAEVDFIDLHNQLIIQYEKVVSEELKLVDDHHLDLGMRYSKGSPEVMAGCTQHDVFSFNCYKRQPTTVLNQCGGKYDIPLLIGEWHIGGADQGKLSYGLVAATTQEERGKAIDYYLQRAFSNKDCIGAHYFEMNDQPLLGRFDGECMQHGLIDICNQEYVDAVKHLQATNSHMYEYVVGEIKPTNLKATYKVSK